MRKSIGPHVQVLSILFVGIHCHGFPMCTKILKKIGEQFLTHDSIYERQFCSSMVYFCYSKMWNDWTPFHVWILCHVWRGSLVTPRSTTPRSCQRHVASMFQYSTCVSDSRNYKTSEKPRSRGSQNKPLSSYRSSRFWTGHKCVLLPISSKFIRKKKLK